jgi:hypothetical protein
MDILNNNKINILDLPNEMLLSIFNKLSNIDILYSLVDVNQRFDQLVLNSLYIHDLDFTSNLLLGGNRDDFYVRFNRICENIVPRICHQINKLTLGEDSINRIINKFYFPQLHSLSFNSISSWRLSLYFLGMLHKSFSFN